MSFKKASEELAVTPTAVSHQIKLLEGTLGQKLFERRTRQVVLTEVGQQLLPAVRDGFDIMAGAVERITANRDQPSVIITTTTAFAAHWLVPRLATFRLHHPTITLSVLASDEIVNLDAGKADLAIRLCSSPPHDRGAKALVSEKFTPVASPALKIATPDDLKRNPLIQFDWHRPQPQLPSWPKWLEAAGLEKTSVRPRLRFNEESHALQAAIAGQGVALLSLVLAADALRRRLLVQPFQTTIPGDTYYLMTGKRIASAPVGAVCTWILGEAASEGLLMGAERGRSGRPEGTNRRGSAALGRR